MMSNNSKNFIKKFENVCEKLNSASLTHLLQETIFLPSKDVETMGVTYKNNKFIIYYNENFVDSIDDDFLTFVVAHELLHILLYHLVRGKRFNRRLYNYVCDYVVNNILINVLYPHGLKIPKDKIITDINIQQDNLDPYKQLYYSSLWSTLTTEEIYRLLEKEISEDKIKLNINDSLDNHQFWYELNVDEAELTSKINSFTMQAGFGAFGELIGVYDLNVIRRQILKDLNKFINYLNFESSKPTRVSKRVIRNFKKLHRLNIVYDQYPFVLPNYRIDNERIKIALLIDASGSMMHSEDYLHPFVYEVLSTLTKTSFLYDVYSFDSEYYKILDNVEASQLMNKLKKVGLKGKGGTNPQELLNSIKNMPAIMITDGLMSEIIVHNHIFIIFSNQPLDVIIAKPNIMVMSKKYTISRGLL